MDIIDVLMTIDERKRAKQQQDAVLKAQSMQRGLSGILSLGQGRANREHDLQMLLKKAEIESKMQKQTMQDLFDMYKNAGYFNDMQQPEGTIMPHPEGAIDTTGTDEQGNIVGVNRGDYQLVPTFNPASPFKMERSPEAKTRQETKTKQIAAEKMAEQNVSLVSGALNRLSQTYVDAYKEKGVGSLGRSIVSGGALKFGGGWGAKYPATGALVGQKTEVITRMMPLLTQQGDKPGSVRLVSTVFDKLWKTLPDNNTPPITAKRMMTETIRNMFGFSKAIKDMGITNEMVAGMNDIQLKKLGNSIEQNAKRMTFSPQEQEQVNAILEQVLAPMDELIGGERNLPANISEEDIQFTMKKYGVSREEVLRRLGRQ